MLNYCYYISKYNTLNSNFFSNPTNPFLTIYLYFYIKIKKKKKNPSSFSYWKYLVQIFSPSSQEKKKKNHPSNDFVPNYLVNWCASTHSIILYKNSYLLAKKKKKKNEETISIEQIWIWASFVCFSTLKISTFVPRLSLGPHYLWSLVWYWYCYEFLKLITIFSYLDKMIFVYKFGFEWLKFKYFVLIVLKKKSFVFD